MQSIKTALRQKWYWVCQNKPFWLHMLFWSITVIVVAVRPAEVNGTPTDFPVRFWGMWLQLIGAYTVWMDMTKTAQDFGEAPSFRKTWEYLRAFFRKPQSVNGSANIELAAATCNATGRLSWTLDPNQPLDVRTSHLERFVTSLDAEMAGMQTQIGRQKQELSDEITKQTGGLQQSIGSLQNQLKDALIGNYTVLRFGAFWLVFGIVLSSVAVEITNFFHMHWQLPRFW